MTDQSSAAFERLSPSIQRWIWRQQWNELHDIQEQAINPILDGRDVLISSPTASGKTEAAFLPICTVLADTAAESLGVIYISPLKALINDQFLRLQQLFECIDATVTPWHGDIAGHVKQRLIRRPRGALLITPESMEALFVTRGSSIPTITDHLRFIVVDELHAFIGTERGRQLQSLMHRLEVAAQRLIPRVGLSATLGDPGLAAEFLRARHGECVKQITSRALSREVLMQVRGYRTDRTHLVKRSVNHADANRHGIPEVTEPATTDDFDVSRHLFEMLRGRTNLVFANRRMKVELFADLLRRQEEQRNLPNEFLPHHGSLAREIREAAEERLRGSRPATVIATTTLELGIDIGAVDSIAQIGPPVSVASLTQRLGRSGRTAGEPSVIRIYIQEPEIDENTSVNDQLRVSLVQTVAMIRLLLKRWVEPPPPSALHLSTLIQQLLSLTAQHGGFRAAEAYRALCSSGPFAAVDQPMFAQLLRDMASHDLLTQTHDGMLVLDMPGERLVNHYDFFAAFTSPGEWRLVAESRPLGTLPITSPLLVDSFLIFAGRRWRIVGIDEKRREVELEIAVGGLVPRFDGNGALIHDRIRKEMRQVYIDTDVPIYLDSPGRDLLREGRKCFERFNLSNQSLLQQGRDTHLFPWVGDQILNTLALQFRTLGAEVVIQRPALVFSKKSPDEVIGYIGTLATSGPSDISNLAASVKNKHSEKHHIYLSEDLLVSDYASSQLDANGAWQTLMRLSNSFERAPSGNLTDARQR